MRGGDRRVTRQLDEIGELVGLLRSDLADLARRASTPSGYDGYPSSTLGGGGGGGGGFSDPLGDAVATKYSPGANRDGDVPEDRPVPTMGEAAERRDPLVAAVVASLAHLDRAVVELRRADDHRRKARDLQSPDRLSVRADPTTGCTNCERYTGPSGDPVWSAIEYAGRCAACLAYRRAHDGRDAPEAVVLARPEVSGRPHRIDAAEVPDSALAAALLPRLRPSG